MRLDFNVLWVDDQPDNVGSQIEGISNRMAAEGFDFSPTLCNTVDEARQQLAVDVFNDEVDLVMVDWDLGGGQYGQDAISEIRQRIQFKDVIFYSAKSDVDELRKFAFEKGLEGVFCAHRDGLVDEVMGVFDSLVKKVLDLDHTRGVVMGATSDIDNLVKECLVALDGRMDDAGKERLADSALKKIAKRLKDNQKKLEALQSEPKLADVLGAQGLFQAYDALRLLTNALGEDVAADCKQHEATVRTYMEDVVPLRNKLGHRVLRGEKPIGIQRTDGELVEIEEMRQLRRTLLETRASFWELHSVLFPPS